MLLIDICAINVFSILLTLTNIFSENPIHIALFGDYIDIVTFYLTVKPSFSHSVINDLYNLIVDHVESNIKSDDNTNVCFS